MANVNRWANFGLEDSPPTPRRRLFKHLDTSRMSWHDCHIGYTWLGIAVLVFGFPWVLAGMIAMLNGGYASAFALNRPGNYSRFVWWLALFASVLIFGIFTTGEMCAQQGGLEIQDVVVLLLITKLALGQLMFLFRMRREGRQANMDQTNFSRSWT